MFRILLAEELDRAAEARLEAAADVVRAETRDEATLADLVADCDALVARTHSPVTRRVLEAGSRLKAVGIAGVGVDNVDVTAAQERGVAVLNVPGASSDAVAEFTLALMLNLLRPVAQLAGAYARGQSSEVRRVAHGPELRGLTVGIVGMGRIGSRVARLCSAGCGACVLFNDIVDVGPFAFPAEAAAKERIWRECDVVSLHVPLTEETRGMLSGTVIDRLKQGSYLVNTCRGAVVETDALTGALRSGHLGGAALDVTSPEPLPPEHELFRQPNCILTPHVAARTHGGLRRMFDVVDDVLAYLRTRG